MRVVCKCEGEYKFGRSLDRQEFLKAVLGLIEAFREELEWIDVGEEHAPTMMVTYPSASLRLKNGITAKLTDDKITVSGDSREEVARVLEKSLRLLAPIIG